MILISAIESRSLLLTAAIASLAIGCGGGGALAMRGGAAGTTRTSFTCAADHPATDQVVRLSLEDDLSGGGATCVVRAASTATICADQLAQCAATIPTPGGVAISATVFSDRRTVDFVPAVVIRPVLDQRLGEQIHTAPVQAPLEPPPNDDGQPRVRYAGLMWELEGTEVSVADLSLGEVLAGGGLAGRVGWVFDRIVAASIEGVWTWGRGRRFGGDVGEMGAGAVANVEFFDRRFMGIIDLNFSIGLGAWWPTYTACGPTGSILPSCHTNAAAHFGFRLMPTGGPSHAGGSAINLGLDFWVGYSPETGGWTFAPLMVIGLASY